MFNSHLVSSFCKQCFLTVVFHALLRNVTIYSSAGWSVEFCINEESGKGFGVGGVFTKPSSHLHLAKV